MSGIYEMRVSFEMQNGSTFAIEWTERRYGATFNDPAETDAGEYTCFIDEDEVHPDDLPKGLDTLVEEMYNDPYSVKFACGEHYLGRRPAAPY